MTLLVDVRHRLGAFELDAAFERSGRLVALFGPSGSGKTSLVNLIGGLMRPSEGKIVVDGRALADTAARTFVPRHKRRIGYVFQDARLFPHMTVSQNLRVRAVVRAGRRTLRGFRPVSWNCSASGNCWIVVRACCPAEKSSASRSAAHCLPAPG